MASATVPKLGHIYDPISDETITDSSGIVETVITDRTQWQQLCNPEVMLSNEDYKSLFDEFDVLEDCPNCNNKAIELDPDNIIFDF